MGVGLDILERAAELTRRRRPFALATVVWRRAPTSGKPGCRALVTADGQLEGWIGGACSRPAVIRQGLRALEDGQPRLLCLGLEHDFPASDESRIVEPITCSSEGAMELFIEPHLPRPQLVAIGDEPVARALGAMARALAFEVVAVVPGGGERAEAHRRLDTLELSEAKVGEGSFVVVATMGQYDEDALRAALETEAPYIALVASRRRATAVLDTLRREGVAEDQLARIHAPAGLDLGPIAHQEIAVAVLAEVVQLKAQGVGAITVSAAAIEEAADPVCGMTVTVAGARHVYEHDGQTYYFCCDGCRRKFAADPAAFLAAMAAD